MTDPPDTRSRLLETVADLVIELADDGTIRSIDGETDALLGRDRDALLGAGVSTLLGAPSPTMGDFDATAERPGPLLDGAAESVEVALETEDGSAQPATADVVETDDGYLCAIRAKPEGGSFAGRQYVDAIGDPVCVIDTHGRIERVNDAMIEYTGYAREALEGRKLGELIPAAEYERAREQVRSLTASDSQTTFETSLVTDDGRLVVTEANCSLLVDDGTAEGIVAVLRDIEDRTERERDLELIKEVLTRVIRHNFRNDLNLVLGHAELLADAVPDAYVDHASKVVETTEGLVKQSEKVRLIEDVVDSGGTTSVDLPARIGDLVEEYRSAYPDATIEFEHDGTDAVVSAHPRIATAIEELLDNALRHAASDEPWASVRIEAADGKVTVFVEDDAGGIDDHELAVLRKGSETDLEHGSGVGLWLVRWLVDYSDAALLTDRTDQGTVMGIRFRADDASIDQASGIDSPVVDADDYLSSEGVGRIHGPTVVGRMDELHELETLYDAVLTSGGRAAFVTGQPGIGKTALVDEFLGRIGEGDNPPLVGRATCRPGRTPPYHPIQALLEDLPVRDHFDDILDDLPTVATDEEQSASRKQLFSTVAGRIRDLALDHPVVLIIEDLHWADSATSDLIAHLIDEVGRWALPIVFLGTTRTDVLTGDTPISALLDGADGDGRTYRQDLQPLDEADVRTLLNHHLETETVPPAVVKAVHERSGGVPLFVTELSRHLLDTVGPSPSPEAFPDDPDEVGLPETIERAVLDSLEGLTPPEQSLLELGAVVGLTAPLPVLEAAVGDSTGALEEHVDALCSRRLWTVDDEGVSFVHGVVRETVLGTLDDDRRRALHRRVATAIEAVFEDDLGPHFGRLSDHYRVAGMEDRAFEYARRAGDRAAEQYAFDTAIDYYRQAIVLAEAAPSEHDLTGLRTDLAATLRTVGELETAAEVARDGLEAAADRSRDRCRLLGIVAAINTAKGEYDRAIELTEDQRAIAAENGYEHLEGDAIQRLGSLARRRGAYDDAEQYYHEAIDIAEGIGDRGLEAQCLKGLAAVEHSRGAYDRAMEYSRQGLEIARDLGDRHHEAKTLNTMGAVASARGEYELAIEYYQKSLERKRELGNRHAEARTLSNLGLVEQRRSEYESACERYEESLAVAREIDDSKGAAYSLHNLGEVAIERGQYEEARRRLRRSLDLVRDLGDRRVEVANLTLLGRVARLERSLDEARSRYGDALDLAVELDLERWRATALQGNAAVARREGELETAAETIEEVLELREAIDDPSGEAQALLERGRIALARSQLDAARAHAIEANDAFESLGSDHWLARANRLLGRIDLETGAVEDGLDHLTAAVDTFERIGAVDDALSTLWLITEQHDRADEHELADQKREQAEQPRERARRLLDAAPEEIRDRHRGWIYDDESV